MGRVYVGEVCLHGCPPVVSPTPLIAFLNAGICCTLTPSNYIVLESKREITPGACTYI
jgi:hypothetical protein